METGPGGRREADDFDEIFRVQYDRMVRALTAAYGDREAAADAVQDAFTRAYARWGRIGRYEDPAGWVRHVAVNRLRDHFRRATRGRRAVERLAGRVDTTAAMAGPEPGSDLLAHLATLPQQQRTALSLFYVEELSVLEVAEAMGLSEGAVKYHLHAGREQLRTRLDVS
jgi:RNA polymerase sigma-70 factor (ECF subfamily)